MNKSIHPLRMNRVSIGFGRCSALSALSFLGVIASTLQAAGPGSSNDFGGRRVMIFGIDGCRGDAVRIAMANGTAPNLKALADDGVMNYGCFAGGILGTPSQQPTWSGPGWSSVLCGVWTNKHGVTDNSFSGARYSTYPHFFKRIKTLYPSAYTASMVDWLPIHSEILNGSKANKRDNFCNFVYNAPGYYATGDAQDRDAAISQLQATNPDVMFTYFVNVDETGHSSGFTPGNPAYMSALTAVDQNIGAVVNAVRARPQYAQEDWLFIVTSDHGGTGNNGHAGNTATDRAIFMIVSGGNAAQGLVRNDAVGQCAVPATALKHLGIPVNSSWGWEEPAYGFGPFLDGASASKYAILDLILPVGGVSGATATEVYRDGVKIATLSASAVNYVDTPPSTGSSQPYQYEVRWPGSSQVPLKTSIAVNQFAITDNQVVRLGFDGNTNDSSGRGNHGIAGGNPSYTAGKTGQALSISGATQHVSLGNVADVNFGTSTDFSFSAWVKTTPWAGDPTIISNKNWASGSNNGWVVAAGDNTSLWQWNFKGAAATRRDFDNGGTINDNQWHQITVSHTRDGNADFYHDGVKVGSVSIAGSGNIDTGLPTVIGDDGTFNYAYPWNVPLVIDDVRIWRRALTAGEASTLFDAQLAFKQWQQANFTSSELSNASISGPGADPDNDGLTNFAEFAYKSTPKIASAGDAPVEWLNGGTRHIDFIQRNGGTGTNGENYSADGARYVVSYSADGINWVSGSQYVEEAGLPVSNGDGTHTVTIRVKAPNPSGSSSRLRVELIQEN